MNAKIAASVLGLLGAAPLASAAGPLQWTAASGGNDHYYAFVDAPGITFDQARAAANASTFAGDVGQLVVFANALDYADPEYRFVYDDVYAPHGGNGTFWIGAEQTVIAGHGINDDWYWENGQAIPAAFLALWVNDHQEDNSPGATYGGVFYGVGQNLGDYGTLNQRGISVGYVVEYAPAVPEPTSAAMLASLALPALLRRRR